jgi:coniferyl-aldehyde dehydrogenase
MTATPSPVPTAFARLRAGYAREPFPSADAREDRLLRLERAVVAHADAIVAAADADFGGRSRHETLLVDVVTVVESLGFARRRVRAWCLQRRWTR